MSNNNNSLIVIGIAAAVLLCGMAGAIIAISSDSNDTNDSNENTYVTLKAEAGAANGEVSFLNLQESYDELPRQVMKTAIPTTAAE